MGPVSQPAPLVTVILATCNSESFVADAIDSVLLQTGITFELLVGDDGSADGTLTVARHGQDKRLEVIATAMARGRASTLNALVRRARGEFVAVVDAADAWIGPDKLSRQVDLLQSRPDLGATFGRARKPTSKGAARHTARVGPIAGTDSAIGSRGRWLRHLLLTGNDLCHSSVLLRRQALESAGGYDERLRETLDLDLWIRLARQWNLHVSDRELVQCRESAPAADEALTQRLNRQHNEEYLVYETFFEALDPELLRAGFADLMVNPQADTPEELAVEMALLFFRVDGAAQAACWSLGLERMYALLGDPRYRPALRAHGIDDPWLHAKMAQFSPFLPEAGIEA
jgi:glycosyltransferase involved in cell wall biosynthesis